MHLYMSGTPRNDPYQTVENRLNTHRLFSMHGEYEKQVLRWVTDLRKGILDADEYLRAYPQHIDLIKARDIKRRAQQADYGREVDWDTAEVLEHVCQRLKGRPYPKAILLDSGAFTAWNKGETTTVDDVRRKYSKFIEAAGDMFDEIWGINLDVIPGEKGRDPTPDELKRAVEVSDINFEILVKEFGDIILPVYHQGEDVDRLRECVEQVDGKSNYICVSPRNDLAESHRVVWSRDAHSELKKRWPHIMTHGLATTGNKMVRTVPWYSGDSAAWVQHGGYGMIDIFHDEHHSFGKKKDPHYMNYFVSFENVDYETAAVVRTRDGEPVTALELGVRGGETRAEVAALFKQAGVAPDDFPLVGGHYNDDTKAYFELSEPHRAYIRGRVEALGFPFEVCMWDSRVRNLICMAEFVAFAEWAKSSEKDKGQQYLLGDL
uniref:Queuosine tRNA-ribosyltransferase n=1 Tax=Dinoroseobacter phage vB_DshS_R26L TaxID=3161158 RepID=A0AAU7VGF8_9CAUD